MYDHRKEVKRVLELLSYMTVPYDPDSLDLDFTTDSKKHKPKRVKQVLKLFDERLSKGTPDMRERFAPILEDYQDRFGRKNTWTRMLHRNSTPPVGPRRLSLYVLTNGIWQPGCDLVTEIKTLVKLLQEHNMTNKYIGIQFIRFGHDKKGKERLRMLDSGLQKQGLVELDVVDTTSANGNVYKMLLGAVNDWYDNVDELDSETDDR
ncbi:MAG: hypothetical protein Q9222_006679 [Ikaeria aurantiellina]